VIRQTLVKKLNGTCEVLLTINYWSNRPVVPNRWVATPKWVAEEFLWGREQ